MVSQPEEFSAEDIDNVRRALARIYFLSRDARRSIVRESLAIHAALGDIQEEMRKAARSLPPDDGPWRVESITDHLDR